MSTRHILPVILLAGTLLVEGASAQTPAGPARFIVPHGTQSPFLANVAMDGAGNATFLWTVPFGGSGSRSEVYTRRFSSADLSLGPAVRLDAPRYDASAGTVAANQRGDVLVTWSRFFPSSPLRPTEYLLRRTSPVLRTLTLRLKGPGDVAVDKAGNFVAVWTAETPAGTRVFGQRYNADGTPRGPEFNAATSTTGSHISPSVAMNPNTGEFVVVWEVRDAESSGIGVFGQRFGFTTGRQGREFAIVVPPVSERPGLIQFFLPQVARAADGGFIVIWRNRSGSEILGQRYNSSGGAVGDPVIIDDKPHFESRPEIAMSPAGDFVVAWDDLGALEAWFRLFHRDGTPAGPVIAQTPLANSPYLGGGKVAFGGNGTLIYAWTNYNDEPGREHIISYRRYAASPADELCLYRLGHFRCDTGRTGGAPETDHVLGVAIPLLGDVDGDGREDYCLFHGNRFSCDSNHDGGTSEASVVFGQPGDTPLLGDVDGDGRDDVCVFRLDRFLCDSGHNGGPAETEIAFGQPGDRPLLGDVDGDGRDEACVSRGGEFRCDTAHDGGAAETVIAFGGAGTPLLGDFDGDGRDDACVFLAREFRCDTAHNGGAAEAILAVLGTGRPLIGNVDGL